MFKLNGIQTFKYKDDVIERLPQGKASDVTKVAKQHVVMSQK